VKAMKKNGLKKRLSYMDQRELTELKTRSGAGAHRDRRAKERMGKGALRRKLLEEAW